MGTLRVVPTGKTTVYEAALPWANLGAEGMEAGRPFQFSLLVNHLGANNIRGWIEYGAGVGLSKTPPSSSKRCCSKGLLKAPAPLGRSND